MLSGAAAAADADAADCWRVCVVVFVQQKGGEKGEKNFGMRVAQGGGEGGACRTNQSIRFETKEDETNTLNSINPS